MKTRNAMQLKALVRNLAREKGVSAQLVLQNYALERLLERISLSPYRDNLILKGGLYLASVMGLESRATMDMDTTLRNHPLEEGAVLAMFEEICAIEVDDDVDIDILRVEPIREDDAYGGLRVHMRASYPPMEIPFKVDVTAADAITPGAIEYGYSLMFDDRNLNVLAYNLETSLAEKLEAVVSRGDQTTRMRDYYDIYMLPKLKGDEIDMRVVGEALAATSGKRGTAGVMDRHAGILGGVRASEAMHELWDAYRNDFPYAAGIELEDAVDAASEIMARVWRHGNS